jgi:hypothetical protein
MMQDQTPTLPEQKPRRVPPKVRQAINEYVSGRARTKEQAAKTAGISREYFSRSCGLPHVAAYLRDQAARHIATGAARAAAKMVELMEAKNGRVAHDSAKFVLGVAGIKPAPDAQPNVNVNIKAGFVIRLVDPEAAPGDRAKVIVAGDVATVPAAAE